MPKLKLPTAADLRSRIDEITAETVTDALVQHHRSKDDIMKTATFAGRDLLASEQRQYKEHMQEISKLEVLHDEVKIDRSQIIMTGDNPKDAPQFMQRVAPFDGSDALALRPQVVRDKALAALEYRHKDLNLPTPAMDKVDKLVRSNLTNHTQCDGSLIARRILLTENDDYRSAFMRVTTDPKAILTENESRALRAFEEFRAMSGGTDSAGGFGVPVFIDPSIIMTAQGSPNDILDIAQLVTITTDSWKGVSSAGVSWSFDTEGAEVSDDSPTLAQPEVPVHTARGFVPFSIEIGMDYPGFADELATMLREGYMELVSQKTTLGTGVNEPTGIVTALDANAAVEVLPTTDGAFVAADLYKLWDALPIKYRNRGDRVAWMSSTDVQNEVRNFGTTMGSNFTVDLTDEAIPRLFGRRYFLNDWMADFTSSVGAANLLIVGDWKNFLVAQRAGMSVELVPHMLGAAGRPTGQRGLFAWARIGSGSVNDLGFRILQNQ
ncbi:HK97 family phage major capsid protein [Nonomuraea muscovyensis]|uniref:HK97 family phage major capsid protein n=1 Tax=Nonomuraea muscovyensis TaxID=1124761 RepID=A0A7X0CB20_9ACTN|nr:phage major capsid protein [Nonomuraea muscovyensis]MBB6351867.1 HK97 family phage major capsid protein [Nonomuraea muscovyensis]